MDLLNISSFTQHFLVCEMLITYPELAAGFIDHVTQRGGELPEFTEELLLSFSEGIFSNYELFDGTIRLCQLLQPMHSLYLERFTIP